MEYQDGPIFEGHFKDDRANGFGKIIGRNYTYEGNFLDGMKNGNGKFYLI